MKKEIKAKEITITVTKKEYAALQRCKNHINTLYKSMKEMSCFEYASDWNRPEDITNGLTAEEAHTIMEKLQRIKAYLY